MNTERLEEMRKDMKEKRRGVEMSFWQCPACVREVYLCDKTHLKLHLMREHGISGRMLTRIIEGLTPAFEQYPDDSNEDISVSENEIFSESKLQKEEVH